MDSWLISCFPGILIIETDAADSASCTPPLPSGPGRCHNAGSKQKSVSSRPEQSTVEINGVLSFGNRAVRFNGANSSEQVQLTKTFDSNAENYDGWYDLPEGRAIFDAELKCLRLLCPAFSGRWLEVGVGSGRFASGLGIAEGLDSSSPMLEIAVKRGIKPIAGHAEDLPFSEKTFDGILVALTLCFVTDAGEALRECHRVLRSNGKLVLAIVTADSAWGLEYARRTSRADSVYAGARFRTAAETLELARSAGFTFIRAEGTLFWKPGEMPETEPRIETGISLGAGFVASLFEKAAS
jgi:ubiquinone/menaquinone biosynthesis C-methylase UbiE